MQNVKANVFWTTRTTTSAFCTRSASSFAFWTQCVSYRHRVSKQMSSGRGVSGHLPSECSACLTDAECQGKFLLDTECQGKCRTDDTRHSICLLDKDCQGISLLDAECQGKCRPEDACHSICLLDEECIRHPDAARLTDAECQGKWDPDEAYDGTPHIGNSVVTVVASKHDCQGTVHCSEYY